MAFGVDYLRLSALQIKRKISISIGRDHQKATKKIPNMNGTSSKYVTMADSSKQQTLPEETSSRQNERIKILRKGKLCYGCLKPMAKDHNAKNWQQ